MDIEREVELYAPCTHRNLDGATRREQQQVHPAGSGVDEPASLISNVSYRPSGDGVRLLKNVVLHILLVAAILEHLLKRDHTSHTTSDSCSNLGGMHVLVELIWIGNA